MGAQQPHLLRIFFLVSYLAVCVLSIGPLGIAWNKDLATRPKMGFMVWQSVLEYDETLTEDNLSNEQLAGLARDAHKEMRDDHGTKPWTGTGISNKAAGKWPSIMTAIVKDNKVYLSSSQRSCTGGQAGYAYNTALSPVPVQMALYECITSSDTGSIHKSGGLCGEQMAAVIAFNEITDGSQKLPGSRVWPFNIVRDLMCP